MGLIITINREDSVRVGLFILACGIYDSLVKSCLNFHGDVH